MDALYFHAKSDSRRAVVACPFCGQRMLVRAGVALPPLLAVEVQ